VMRVFPPFKIDGTGLLVRDSEGCERTYEVRNEAVTPLDEVVDLLDRTMGYSITLVVYGEWDMADPTITPAMTDPRIKMLPK